MLVDTHCHLTSPELLPQADAALRRAREAGVERVILVATSVRDAELALNLMRQHAELDLVAGVHPHEAGRCGPVDFEQLAALLAGRGIASGLGSRIVGVGETGLDFHYDFAPRNLQEAVFRQHLELARASRRPVVIHARESEANCCDILEEYPDLAGRVVFHCFSADLKIAQRILDHGWLVSYTGVVTFRNAATIRETARFVPADRMMLETDAPYLSPEPVRKVRPNEPAFVAHTARFVAELRGVTLETLAAETTATAARFFSRLETP